MEIVKWFKHNNKLNLNRIKREETKDQKIKRLEEELLVFDELYRICRALPTATKREIGILNIFEEKK